MNKKNSHHEGHEAHEEKKPEIRFQGYNDEWEERELGEVVDLENGYAFKSKFFIDKPNNVVVLTPGNVNIGGSFQKGKGHYYDMSGKFPNKFILKPHDIFVTMTDLTPSAQALGYPALIPDDGITYLHNQRLGKLIDYIGDKQFLFQLLNTEKYHTHIVSTASGTTVKHSSPNKILSYKNYFPSPAEQTQIGTFFQKIDTLIVLRQKKLDKLKNTKKAFLNKMFPKEGSDVPEIRFEGFSGKWERKELGEIAKESHGGGTPTTAIKEYWNGNIPWIQSSDLKDDQLFNVIPRKKISGLGLKSSAAKLIPKESIAIVTRVGFGKIALMDYEYTASQDFLSLSKLEIDNLFGVYSIWKKIQNELHTVQGTSIKGITKDEILAKKISIPSPTEQTKIGNFFQTLDRLIGLQEKEIDKLKNLKKAFLEKMFV